DPLRVENSAEWSDPGHLVIGIVEELNLEQEKLRKLFDCGVYRADATATVDELVELVELSVQVARCGFRPREQLNYRRRRTHAVRIERPPDRVSSELEYSSGEDSAAGCGTVGRARIQRDDAEGARKVVHRERRPRAVPAAHGMAGGHATDLADRFRLP